MVERTHTTRRDTARRPVMCVAPLVPRMKTYGLMAFGLWCVLEPGGAMDREVAVRMGWRQGEVRSEDGLYYYVVPPDAGLLYRTMGYLAFDLAYMALPPYSTQVEYAELILQDRRFRTFWKAVETHGGLAMMPRALAGALINLELARGRRAMAMCLAYLWRWVK